MTKRTKPKDEPKRPAHRPSSYTLELAESICDLVASGENLERICAKDDFPSKDTVYKWLRKHPEFADEYATARARRADARSDRIDEIKERCLNGKITSDVARVVIDAEKWQAGKENAKKYGDRVALAGDDESPLRVMSDDRIESRIANLIRKAGAATSSGGDGA